MCFLVPMFSGAFTIGMAVSKGIQVSNVARDAVVLMVRAITDPNSGLDLSQTQNQRIIVKAAQGLGMNSDAQYDPSTTGNGVVILSKVVLVGANECSLGIVPAPSGAPPWNAGNCPNFNNYVFAYRIVIGNGTRWSSVLGNPGATVHSNGTISDSDIASNTADRVANFTTATGMTLTQSTLCAFLRDVCRHHLPEFLLGLAQPHDLRQERFVVEVWGGNRLWEHKREGHASAGLQSFFTPRC